LTIEPGARLLHYELVEKIGEGGMGVVWKAIDTTLDRPVAVKLLPPNFIEAPERLVRFEREAKLLAALNHPNIASIFSVHQAEGQHFIALELIEGQDLAARTEVGPLPLEDTLQICLAIAEALEAAHGSGVIHRDLKPANVKLASDGRVKVLDFGLAKAIEPQTSSDGTSPTFAATVTSAGTRDGVILGTAAYMSPEQARGRPVDQRADLWSFGCVLYECLTGHVLFRGETVSDSLAAVLRKDPDWSRLPAETPTSVRALLRRCLTRDPSRRLHSASDARIELLDAIEHPQGDTDSNGPVLQSASNLGPGVAALLVVLGLAVGWGLTTLLRPGPSEPPKTVSHVAIPLPPSLRLDLSPRLTPDGETVVFRAMDTDASGLERAYRLFVRDLGGDDIVEVKGSLRVLDFSLSPDGRSIAFVAEATIGARPELFRVPVDQSAPPQRLADWDNDLGPVVWLNDETIVAFQTTDYALRRFPASGGPSGEPMDVTGDPTPISVGARAALPDGGHVLVMAVTFETGVYQQTVGVVDTETGAFRRLIDHGSEPVYMPPGYLVFSRADQLLVVPFDAENLEVTGSPQTVLDGLWATAGYAGGSFAVSMDGDLAYYTGGVQGSDRRIVLSDREGTLTPWSDHRQQFVTILVSPDARYLAAMVDNTGEGDDLLQIRVSELDRPRLLTVGAHVGMDCGTHTWSPDSQRIAYACSGQDTVAIYVTSPTETGSSRLLLEYPEEIGGQIVGFSADSSQVFVWRFGPEGKREIVSVAVEGTDPSSNFERMSTDDEAENRPDTSRDGHWLLYFSRDTGRRELYVREIVNGHTLGPRRSIGLDADLAWWSNVRTAGMYELMVLRDRRLYSVDLRMSPTLEAGSPVLLGVDLARPNLDFSEALPDGRLIHIQYPDSERGSSEMRLILNWREELDAH
jgi:serine/threonine protein kinase